jgi:hypothetical protein
VSSNAHDVSSIPGIIMVMSRWLTEDEQRAWRGLLQMTSQLNARMNRQLQDDYGVSLAD